MTISVSGRTDREPEPNKSLAYRLGRSGGHGPSLEQLRYANGWWCLSIAMASDDLLLVEAANSACLRANAICSSVNLLFFTT